MLRLQEYSGEKDRNVYCPGAQRFIFIGEETHSLQD